MSNRSTIFDNGRVQFFVYESGEDDYLLGFDSDDDHIDIHATIGTGLTSKQIIEYAMSMIQAVAPWEGQMAGKIHKAVADIADALRVDEEDRKSKRKFKMEGPCPNHPNGPACKCLW